MRTAAEAGFALLDVAPLNVVNDTRDPNPLIRSLALRTMASINVDKIVATIKV